MDGLTINGEQFGKLYDSTDFTRWCSFYEGDSGDPNVLEVERG